MLLFFKLLFVCYYLSYSSHVIVSLFSLHFVFYYISYLLIIQNIGIWFY